LKNPKPGRQKIQALTSRADSTFKYLKAVHEDLTQISKESEAYISSISDFVATFKDNPARRLISIVIGAILGLVVAGFMRLDIVAAAGGIEFGNNGLGNGLGVAITGLLVGLGSSPTHEAVRALQKYKESKKG
jgi:hypothetical protein